MKLPYRFRIMTAIGTDVFELVRAKRRFHPSDEAFWFEGREDRTWLEEPLLNSETDTDRPRLGKRNSRVSTKINPEENAALENRGLKPEYKT